jgi:tetratricopeptide (TPR) repeat protein
MPMSQPNIIRARISLAVISLLCCAGHAFSHPEDEHKLEQLNAVITQQPSLQSAYIQRAALYTRTGNYPLAEKDFEAAQTLGDLYLVSHELGAYYFKIKTYVAAINQFTNYLEHYPNHYPTLEYRAKAYREIGKTKKSLEDFSHFLETSPYTNPGHYLTVAQIILSETDQGNSIDDAISIIDLGISRSGNSPQLQSFAVQLEISREFFDAALTRHESLRDITSASPRWHVEMAEILVTSKQWGKARDQLNQSAVKLADYKKTPAREKLLIHIEKLQRHISDKL